MTVFSTHCPVPGAAAVEQSGANGVPAVIEARHVSKRFPGAHRAALEDVSLAVPRGAVYGLIGPNGAGKTTLLTILTGVTAPSGGEVFIAGGGRAGPGRVALPTIGIAPQEAALYPTLTARENLAFFGRMQGLGGAVLRERVAWSLGMGELDAYADQRVDTFSGGYKRRLNLAIALIREPEVLILDEPTVGIDPHSRRFIHDRLRELHRSGVTILMSTHYLEEAEQLCDAVAVLDQGRLVAQGTVAALLAEHHPGELSLELAAAPESALLDRLRALPQIAHLAASGRHVCMRAADPAAAALGVLRTLEGAGVRHLGLSYGAARFESLFLQLTRAD